MSDRYRLDLNPDCYLAAHGHMESGDPVPPCEGRLIRAHVIDKQELTRLGLEWADPRTWVLSCGGLTGLTGHHGHFDVTKKLRLDWDDLPVGVIEFAEEYDSTLETEVLKRWLEKRYLEVRS